MPSRLRTALHTLITTPTGDGLAPLRFGKELARRANRTLGSPLASDEELARRRAAHDRLASLRSRPDGARTSASPAPALQAPVTIYHEGPRNERELARLVELFESKSVTFKKADVADDEATMLFVTHTAGCEASDLPIVFVGSKCVGAYPAVVAADVSGTLAKLLATG